ncbi:MAG: metallophosphoesterase family protein [Nitrososphaerales archaeon]
MEREQSGGQAVDERRGKHPATRVAVISDVHSNLEALQEVLSRVEGMEVCCLGDVVGYGANPNEVVEALRERKVLTVMGNHDQAAVTGETGMFSARAAMAAKWTSKALAAPNFAYLKSLPKERRLRLGDAKGYLTHGSPDDTLWEYVDPRTHEQLFGHYLERLRVRFVGLGHTHIPFVSDTAEGTVFNPGSVGQPRDGDRRASYAVISAVGGEVKVDNLRVEYDWEAAASKIRAAGLSEQLADRLRWGV